MKKLFMIMLAVVLSLGVASLGYAQAPADKKMEEKKADKAEKKADKSEKKAEKSEKKAEKSEMKAEKSEKKADKAEKRADKAEKKAANPCAAKAEKK